MTAKLKLLCNVSNTGIIRINSHTDMCINTLYADGLFSIVFIPKNVNSIPK